MPPEDRIRLQHMLNAADTAIEFMRGRDRSALDHDRMLLFAVVRAIEVLGEAASKVTPETRERHHDLPWRAATAMRNRLIHGYFDIDARRSRAGNAQRRHVCRGCAFLRRFEY